MSGFNKFLDNIAAVARDEVVNGTVDTFTKESRKDSAIIGLRLIRGATTYSTFMIDNNQDSDTGISTIIKNIERALINSLKEVSTAAISADMALNTFEDCVAAIRPVAPALAVGTINAGDNEVNARRAAILVTLRHIRQSGTYNLKNDLATLETTIKTVESQLAQFIVS